MIYDKSISKEVAKNLVKFNIFKLWSENYEYKFKHNIKSPCLCQCREIYGIPSFSKIIINYLVEIVTKYLLWDFVILWVWTAWIWWWFLLAQHLNVWFYYSSNSDNWIVINGVQWETIKKDIVIVDDSIVTGRSIYDITNILINNYKSKIKWVVSITNRNTEEMNHYSEILNCNMYTLVIYNDILDYLLWEDLINSNHYKFLLDFYKNIWKKNQA